MAVVLRYCHFFLSVFNIFIRKKLKMIAENINFVYLLSADVNVGTY